MKSCGIVKIYHTFYCSNTFSKCHCNEKKGTNLKEEYFQNNGSKEGIYKYYWYNGILKNECNYIDGKLNGSYKEYYEDGELRIECNYIDDKEHGIYKEYLYDGKLIINEIYIDGKLIGSYKEDYEDGELHIECNYIDNEIYYTSDKKNKIQKEYNIDGDLELEILL